MILVKGLCVVAVAASLVVKHLLVIAGGKRGVLRVTEAC